MSLLGSALRQITKSASNPNALLYKVQLARAKSKNLPAGQLGDGKNDVFVLAAPEDESAVKVDERSDGADGAGSDEKEVDATVEEVRGGAGKSKEAKRKVDLAEEDEKR